MYEHHDSIGDEDFISAVEDRTLDPALFDHVGHIRLACLNLQTKPLEEAIDATCTGIKAYAESLGATDKFHTTITVALVKIIDERMGAPGERIDWRRFVEQNRDLVEDCLGVLGRYYSRERLFSEEAKAAALEPDLAA